MVVPFDFLKANTSSFRVTLPIKSVSPAGYSDHRRSIVRSQSLVTVRGAVADKHRHAQLAHWDEEPHLVLMTIVKLSLRPKENRGRSVVVVVCRVFSTLARKK
jgi:hypothetical protein